MSVPMHVGRFVFQNMTRLYMKGWVTDYDDEQEDKLKNGIYEVTSMYIQLYQNLEIRVIDMINGKRMNPKQALDVLCSYSIAEEGTNTLYVSLIEQIALRDPYTEPYTIVELEMILNYFPHAIWQDVAYRMDEDSSNAQSENNKIRSMRERFYTPIVEQTLLSLEVLTDSQFVAVFQGLCLCGPTIFK